MIEPAFHLLALPKHGYSGDDATMPHLISLQRLMLGPRGDPPKKAVSGRRCALR